MPNLSIKDVPEVWAEALRQRAVRNHRSLQGELMAVLEGVVQTEQGGQADRAGTGKGTAVAFDRRGRPIAQRGWKSVEEVLANIRAKHPQPIDNGPSSMEILRAEREARDLQLNRGS